MQPHHTYDIDHQVMDQNRSDHPSDFVRQLQEHTVYLPKYLSTPFAIP